MRTTKPISTISYNTAEYLYLKLSELKANKIISFFAFIQHKAESDEGGKKDHIHLFIEPAKMLQTEDLRQEFLEPNGEDPTKPLGCIAFHSSKFDDWCLYSLHDSRYLAMKGQAREYHYFYDEILSSDADDLNYRYRSIDLLSLSVYADMQDAINQGVTMHEYFARGVVPMANVRNFTLAWELLKANKVERNGRAGHEPSSDQEPSEV